MKKFHLGYKYRLYPTEKQKELFDYQFFIYNQAYNIVLNSQKKQWKDNKILDKKERNWISNVDLDNQIKYSLKNRNLTYKTVVIQQSRINVNKAIQDSFKIKDRGYPKFKNSKLSKQSFNWNNQGFKIIDMDNHKFKILTLMKEKIKMRVDRNFPENYKVNYIVISKENDKYYASFSITFSKDIKSIDKENISCENSIGIDMNINNIALSNGILIKTHSKRGKIFENRIKKLQRKQSRRINKLKKGKKFKKGEKLRGFIGKNFYKTQKKINNLNEKVKNQKKDYYHKSTSKIVKIFDLIVVEDLNNKKMTKKRNTNVKLKSKLNKSILNTSFYQYISMLEYKSMLNDKFFTKINPRYTSKSCSKCGAINETLTLKDRVFKCVCGYENHRDTNASINILNRGLKAFGLGTNLCASNKSLSISDLEKSVS